jgi:YVTN family beta-propeller protein
VLPVISGIERFADRLAQGVAVDASGKLYVANYYGFSVSVFDTAHGNAVLPAITGGLGYPVGVAVDASGKLYVANGGSCCPQSFRVSVFDTAHGNAVLPAINTLFLPNEVAVDTNGKLYVTGHDTAGVFVFDTAHGNIGLPAITGGGLGFPGALAVH